MKIIFFVTLAVSSFALNPPEPIDFIEDAILNNVNHSVDPCDNFYRHACSFSSPNNTISDALRDLYDYLEENQRNAFWNKLDVYTDYIKFETQLKAITNENNEAVEFLTGIFRTVCEERKELLPDITERIHSITEMSIGKEEETTESEMKRNINKRKAIFEDDDCDTAVEKITEIIQEKTIRNMFIILNAETGFQKELKDFIDTAKAIGFHLDVDVRQGIEETRNMVEETLNIAENLIKDTPWAKNAHVVEKIENITSLLAIHDNYGEDFKVIADSLFGIEKNYTNCKNKFNFIKSSDLFCYITTASTFVFPNIDLLSFTMEDNAFNLHPIVMFGYPNYYHSQYGREMSTKLGYTGTAVGHEISHSFFDDHKELQYLPYFSKEAEDCVQNQFEATCREYKEDSCVTSHLQLEENGADIFGFQLAYELLKNYYGFKIGDMIERLQATHEQAFFYSYATSYCSGAISRARRLKNGTLDEHSANNVRVNVIAQHPGFREAFNCPPDSRMMKSVTEQCFIYGNEAPERRRRKFRD